MEPSRCPYLGLTGDPAAARLEPAVEHRCYAQKPSAPVDFVHQRTFCLGANHAHCTLYAAATEQARALDTPTVTPSAPATGGPAWRRYLPWALLAVVILAVAVVYGGDLLRAAPAPAATSPAVAAQPVASSTAAASPTPTFTVTPSATPSPAAVALATADGRLVLAPGLGDSGWWSSAEGRSDHLDDSFLYAGYFDGQAMLSAVRLDLRRIPRGAPIEDGRLRLVGLNGDRLATAAGGTWTVQFLDPATAPDLVDADFQTLFNAPAAVTLIPTLATTDLAMGTENSFVLDAAAQAWLEKQVADGVRTVTLRIVGPGGGADSLFAWDSGTGPATQRKGPQLLLKVGEPPATPPPLPSAQVLVATLTATPANVLTAAAVALTATAAEAGTAAPQPLALATPTPLPANLETAQAIVALAGLPPLVVHTPVPANGVTATANAAYATAVAVTTGTFTPVPTNAVTPLMVLPTPVPANAATALAQLLAATAEAGRSGTPTPLPIGAVVATVTPEPPVVTPTPLAANGATAVVRAAEATLSALTVGTFTPLPRNARTPLPAPTETPLPLLMPVTPPPTTTPTPVVPVQLPSQLRGKILFFSDRDGQSRLYAYDPATGQTLWVTQSWPFRVAQGREGRAPDGNRTVSVENDADKVPHLIVRDSTYNSVQQITFGRAWSYDAAWSPQGDLIAYVSQEPGNDEIYTIRPDGSDARRLTSNDWEWDKHPSWSPDGQQIVFWSNRETGHRQLWIMNADGSNQRRLLNTAYNDWDPIWVK